MTEKIGTLHATCMSRNAASEPCKTEIYAISCRWRFYLSSAPCVNCAAGRFESYPGSADDPTFSTVSDCMDWCGCGSPEDVDKMMLTYLRWLADRPRHGEPIPKCPLSDGEELLLSYIADKLEWTEHGGSVGGAWLADGGERALSALEERAARDAAGG